MASQSVGGGACCVCGCISRFHVMGVYVLAGDEALAGQWEGPFWSKNVLAVVVPTSETIRLKDLRTSGEVKTWACHEKNEKQKK